MRKVLRWISPAVLFLSAWPASSVFAQQAAPDGPASFKVVHVIGLEGIKTGEKGRVTVSKAGLEFVKGPTKSDLSMAWIQDVLTGKDSQRMVGGTLGEISRLGPYGSGTFLSLFRSDIDMLTIEYRDGNGALHGAIFTLPQGQAAMLKAQLVAQGAKTSMSAEDEAKADAESKKAKEKKQ